ncbi:MAG TPA: hypothetical protein VFC70_01320 [Oscillospiraceae bacterium]|nr:hypothetical protein [Oscillospiraceae bacterium]
MKCLQVLSKINHLQFEEGDIKLRELDLKNLNGVDDAVIQSMFNCKAAKEYIVQYWQNYNPTYRSFEGRGIPMVYN